jgi:hypothetical protein
MLLVKCNQQNKKGTLKRKDKTHLLNGHLMEFAPSNRDTWVHIIDLGSPQSHCLEIILDSHV